MSSKPTYIMGIDPGLTGAIAHLAADFEQGTVQLLSVVDVPTINVKMSTGKIRSQLDLAKIPPLYHTAGLFLPDVAVIEEVSAAPGQGVTSMFRFGYVTGALTGIAAALGIQIDTLGPKKWRTVVALKSGQDDPRPLVCAMFPDKNHMFQRSKDHNRADAVLIGYSKACLMAGRRLTPIA